mmetsp:Transcript_100835/g.260614  ORF Transcript_100835/g.260614 Transcript_100835/m.260614 type:complete len:363 (-) Transcript_100835:1219-2307(-)
MVRYRLENVPDALEDLPRHGLGLPEVHLQAGGVLAALARVRNASAEPLIDTLRQGFELRFVAYLHGHLVANADKLYARDLLQELAYPRVAVLAVLDLAPTRPHPVEVVQLAPVQWPATPKIFVEARDERLKRCELAFEILPLGIVAVFLFVTSCHGCGRAGGDATRLERFVRILLQEPEQRPACDGAVITILESVKVCGDVGGEHLAARVRQRDQGRHSEPPVLGGVRGRHLLQPHLQLAGRQGLMPTSRAPLAGLRRRLGDPQAAHVAQALLLHWHLQCGEVGREDDVVFARAELGLEIAGPEQRHRASREHLRVHAARQREGRPRHDVDAAGALRRTCEDGEEVEQVAFQVEAVSAGVDD